MWHARTEGSLFSTPISTGASAPDRSPSSPFPEDDSDADDSLLGVGSGHSPALVTLQSGLREDARAWRAVATRASLIAHEGSLAHQCIVVILPDGSFAATAAALSAAITHRLCTAFHLRAKVAHRLTAGLLAHVHSTNEFARTTLASAGSRPVVLRIALKHVDSLAYSASTQACWFGDGHANVLVVHAARRVAVLIEPSGASVVPALADFLRAVALPTLRDFLLLHNLHMTVQLPTDRLCTLWCAVYAALLLHNWPVHEPEWFWRVVRWAASRRPVLMRAFLDFASNCIPAH